MPNSEAQQLSEASLDKVMQIASNFKVRAKENATPNPVVNALKEELRTDYARTMNKLLFDATV